MKQGVTTKWTALILPTCWTVKWKIQSAAGTVGGLVSGAAAAASGRLLQHQHHCESLSHGNCISIHPGWYFVVAGSRSWRNCLSSVLFESGPTCDERYSAVGPKQHWRVVGANSGTNNGASWVLDGCYGTSDSFASDRNIPTVQTMIRLSRCSYSECPY